MQMNVSLTSELYEIVQKKVKSGLYSNASEVIRDSIRRLEQETRKEQAWSALNNLLEDASLSGRSSKSVEEIVKSRIPKNG